MSGYLSKQQSNMHLLSYWEARLASTLKPAPKKPSILSRLRQPDVTRRARSCMAHKSPVLVELRRRHLGLLKLHGLRIHKS